MPPSYDNARHDRAQAQLPEDPALFLAPTIKRTSQLQKALTQQISMTSIVHCSSERSLNEMNRERNSLIAVRDHVERLLNMLLEIRRLGAGDLVTKESCLKQLDDFRHNLLEAGQAALLDMPDMHVGAHDAIAQVIGFVDGSIIPDSPPHSPERRESDRSCFSSRRMSLDAGFKIGGDAMAFQDAQPERSACYRRYSVGPCDPDQIAAASSMHFPRPKTPQAFRELSNVPLRSVPYGLPKRSSGVHSGISHAHLHQPEPFQHSPRVSGSSCDQYSDLANSASVSAVSCSVASGIGACDHPQGTAFDTQRYFYDHSGPGAVGGYDRFSCGSEDCSQSHVTGLTGTSVHGVSCVGAVSCTAAGASGMCRQLSVRQSCGTSMSGVTCGMCGGSIASSCPAAPSNCQRFGGRGRRHGESMALAWVGRAVLAGGVLLMILQGRSLKQKEKPNKGVRLRLGPVLKSKTRDDSEMEEIILYPPENLSHQMGNP